MTRETKLGLVVAGSFLALVGGVLAVKLHQGALSPSDPDAEAAQVGEGQQPPAKKPGGEPAPGPKNDKPPTQVVIDDANRNRMPSAPPAPAPVAEPVTPAAATEPMNSTPSPVGPPSPEPVTPAPTPVVQASPAPPVPTPMSDPPSAPGPTVPAPESHPAPTPAFPVSTNPAPAANPPAAPEMAPPAPAPAPAPAANPMTPAPDSAPAPTPAVTPAHAPTPDPPPPAPAPAPAAQEPTPSPTMPPAPTPEAAKPPEVKPDTNGKPPGAPETAPAPAAPPSTPPPVPEPSPAPRPAPGADAPGSPPPAQLNPGVASGAVPTVAIIPAAPTNPGNASATLGPPGGAAAPPANDPFTAPRTVRPPEPKAQSYLEEQYRLQPGDNFRSLSQRFYFSDKYEAALLKYNQDYPLARPEMRQDPPAVMPGQMVWIPPVRILERDYGHLIAGLPPLGPNGVPAAPTARPAGPVVTPVSPPPAAANPPAQLTKVRSGGETLYELAKRALNDNGQWYVIYRLNPALSPDPKLPIPAGTVLRLPPEARVEAGDRP
jgi:hypothetical protein